MQYARLVGQITLAALALVACGGDRKPGDGDGTPDAGHAAIVSFEVTPSELSAGDEATASWKTRAATRIELTRNGSLVDLGEAAASEGSVTVAVPETSVFVLTAFGATEVVATESRTVQVATPTEPAILSFAANPEVVVAGDTTTLSWRTAHADIVRILDEAGAELDLAGAEASEGSVETTVDETTTFKLIAERAGEPAAERVVTVTVSPAETPRIVSFVAEPAVVGEGERSTLSWVIEDADLVRLFEGGAEIPLGDQAKGIGSADVYPTASTTYRLVASKGDLRDERSVLVELKRLPVATMTAAPSPIDFGGNSTLTWSTTDAETVQIADSFGVELEGAIGPSGARTVQPSISTTYTLTATNFTGESTQAAATVEVRPKVLTFAPIDPSAAHVGDMKEFHWTTGAATQVVVSSSAGADETFTGEGAIAGSVSLPMGADGVFRIVATSGSHSDEMIYTVEILQDPVIGTFAASKDVISLEGGTATVRLSWTGVENATALELLDGNLGLIPLGDRSIAADSIDVEIEADTTFTLTARNGAAVPATKTATVRTVDLPVVTSISVSPDYVGAGESVELSWASTGATDVIIEADGAAIPGPHAASGSLSYTLMTSTTFEVRAYNEALDFDSKTADAVVGAPQIASFVASSTHAWTGMAVTFEWASQGASELTLSTPAGTGYSTSNREDVIEGSFTTAPLMTVGIFEYTLEITSVSGATRTQTLQVRVGDGPYIESFTVSPSSMRSGEEATVAWTTGPDPDGEAPVLSLTATRGGPYTLPASSPATYVLTEAGAYEFTLTATTGSIGSTPATSQGSTSVHGIPTATLVATPTVFDDEIHTSVELAWTSTNADSSLELFQLDGTNPSILLLSIDAADRGSGTFSALPPATGSTAGTTYRIVATNGLEMSALAEATVTMQPTQVLAFEANPVETYPSQAAPPTVAIISGDDVEVSWTTKRATSVTLDFLRGMEVEETAGSYVDIRTTGGVRLPLASNGSFAPGDEGFANLTFPAGFAFPFNGIDRRSLSVHANGFASFVDVTGPQVPTTSGDIFHLTVFGDDLADSGASGNVFWLHDTDPASSLEYLVLQWNVDGWFSHPNTANLNFQIVLWETGAFEYRYGTMSSSTLQSRADGNYAQIGFRFPLPSSTANWLSTRVNSGDGWLGGLSDTDFKFTALSTLPLQGSKIWKPAPALTATTRTATLTASGIGTASETVDVEVHPRATVALAGPSTAVLRNAPFDISWTTRNATSLILVDSNEVTVCTAAPDEVAAGSCTITSATAGILEYTAVATGALGHTVRRDVSVPVTSVEFAIGSFEVSATEVNHGQPVTLTWETGDADELEIKANGATLALPPSVDINSDSFTIPSLTEETTFVLTIRNLGSGTTLTAQRTVVVRTVTLVATSDSGDVPPGGSVTISWDATSLSGEPAKVKFSNLPMMEDYTGAKPFIDLTGQPDVESLVLRVGGTGAVNDDSGFAIHPFAGGFAFPFQGETYTSVLVKADGFLSFATASPTTGANNRIPSTSLPTVHLAPFWDDLNRRGGTLLAGMVDGDYVISWNHWSAAIGSSAARPFDLNFQVVLRADGSFEYRYGAMNPPNPSPATPSCYPNTCANEANGASATIGYSQDGGTDGSLLHFGGTANGPSNLPFPDGLSGRTFVYSALGASGSIDFNPGATSDYTICASVGAYTECQTIHVVSEFLLSSFDVSSTAIDRGASITFDWVTKNADSLTLKAGDTVLATEVDVDLAAGTFAFVPTETATYTLEVRNEVLGTTKTATQTVSVKQFDLTASSSETSVNPGEDVHLSWTYTPFAGQNAIIYTPMVDVSGTTYYADITGQPGVAPLTFPNVDTGAVTHDFEGGFTFDYLGVTYSKIRVAVDGYVSFEDGTWTSDGSNQTIPNTGAASKRVHLAPFWDDLHLRTGSVMAGPVGTDYVVQWTGVSPTSGSNAPAGNNFDLNFQLVLHADASFEFRYGEMEAPPLHATSPSHCDPVDCSNESNGSSATIGYQDPTGTMGHMLHFGGTGISGTNLPFAGGLAGRAFMFMPQSSSGSVIVNPFESTTYRICAVVDGRTQCVSLPVQAEWGIVSFEASTALTPIGEPINLSWVTAGGESITLTSTVGSTVTPLDLTGHTVAADTFQDLLPEDATYTFTLHSYGRQKTATATVRARRATIEISSPSAQAWPGEVVAVSWGASATGAGNPSVATPMWEIPAAAGTRFNDLDISGHPSATLIFGAGMDQEVAPQAFPAGFVFPYMAAEYTGVYVGVNGFLSFDSTVGAYEMGANQALPHAGYKVHLAPFWDDLFTRTNGRVLGLLLDPDTYVIQWDKVSAAGSSASREYDLNFQVVLYSDGSFEYRYGTMAPPPGTSTSCSPNTCVNEAKGSSATIAYQDPTGAIGQLLHFGGTTSSLLNTTFAGGLENRTFRYTSGLIGTQLVVVTDSTEYSACVLLDGYKECQSIEFVVPGPGDVVVTEVMVNPVGGASMQWFEVRNLMTVPIDLEGWEFETDEGSHSIAEPVVIQPGAYVTLAASINPGFAPTYVYTGGPSLGTGTAGSLTLRFGRSAISEVSWDASWALPAGSSFELDTNLQIRGSTGPGTASGYCAPGTSYDGGANMGTPGVHGEGCSTYYAADFFSSKPTIDISAIGRTIPSMNSSLSRGLAVLSFQFPFFAGSHSMVYPNACGLIAITADPNTCGSRNWDLPFSAAPATVGIIAPMWAFLEPIGPADFKWAEVVVDGQKVAVFQYNHWKILDAPGVDLTFQTQLWQNGDIVIKYIDMRGGPDALGARSTIGLQEAGPNPKFVSYSFNRESIFSGQSIYFKKK